MLLQNWLVVEATVIIGIFALIALGVVRSAGKRKANPTVMPKSMGGRIGFVLLYFLRLIGFSLGTFLAVALGVMVERNVYSEIRISLPAPSEVHIPSDLPFEVQDVKFEGGDGLRMSGWEVPSQNGVIIILLHGYGGNRVNMLWHAKQLVKAGYGVLLYDERASGESEGTRRSFGWEDPRCRRSDSFY